MSDHKENVTGPTQTYHDQEKNSGCIACFQAGLLVSLAWFGIYLACFCLSQEENREPRKTGTPVLSVECSLALVFNGSFPLFLVFCMHLWLTPDTWVNLGNKSLQSFRITELDALMQNPSLILITYRLLSISIVISISLLFQLNQWMSSLVSNETSALHGTADLTISLWCKWDSRIWLVSSLFQSEREKPLFVPGLFRVCCN